MLAALASAASAQEDVTFSQWIQKGRATLRGRALQDSAIPACLSDCVFTDANRPTSCADIGTLFEGTFDSAVGNLGCGLDCNLAADVTAVQSMLRALVPGYACHDAAGNALPNTDESACANTCTGSHDVGADPAVETDCATTFGSAANTYGTSCPAGCTYSVNTWHKVAGAYGREGDSDPGCMLPFSFVAAESTEAATCALGWNYDTSSSTCVWDGSFCAVHTIAEAAGVFTHSYDLPAGKTCQSCHTGYTSDGQYVCPCSLSCVL